MSPEKISAAEIAAIVEGRHADPFSILGVHKTGRRWIARTFIAGAERAAAATLDGLSLGELARLHNAGLFAGPVKLKGRRPLRYHASSRSGSWTTVDAYSFAPVLGPLDDYYAAEGTHLRLYDKLGAHLIEHEGIAGVHFAVWAPNARRVSVVGDFNDWDGRRHAMRKRAGSGVFEIFIAELGEGTLYKYEIIGAAGERLPLKSDPFGFSAELRPLTASRVAAIDGFRWSDGEYMATRAERSSPAAALSIYEVHAGSWRRNATGGFLTYDELAATLIPYAAGMGFTHLELMPVSEHPYDPSWGYQPTGLYAPTSRFGEPAGFARFVDAAHAAGLGVILDWVPAHFPADEHGLVRFDGTELYEHADPRLGFHPDWNTLIYNFGRTEVRAFLINNALFWLDRYHIDGLRVDAVASMLYLDYSRKAGEWLPNRQGGRENLEAIAFLKRLNEVCYAAHPGILMVAEESTAFPGVSRPVHAGGLGFGYKWNMGFMHDTLQYLARDPVHRRHHHDEVTFGLLYAFSENFVLPLSHDEVVHGKGTLLAKMGGDDWQKFAGLRAYYAFMWGYPGKKLLFMGQEFAQRAEWSESRSLDWHLLEAAPHRGMAQLIGDLNRLYRGSPALHARDCDSVGFAWLIGDDAQNSVFAWLRTAGGGDPAVAVVCNFTPVPRPDYRLPLPRAGEWRERINTDAAVYGGSGQGNFGAILAEASPTHGQPASASILLPPLATLILEMPGS